MALRLAQKQAIVAEVSEAAASALSAVLSDYRGLTVEEMTELRAKARASGVYLKVVRNSLARRALEGTEYACLDEALVGPSMLKVRASLVTGASITLMSIARAPSSVGSFAIRSISPAANNCPPMERGLVHQVTEQFFRR